MSSKNRPIREQLEMIYGKGCMFQRARVGERLRELGVEPPYTTYKRKYTLNEQRTLERRMTLHHLKHVSEGGRTSIDNGAEVNELAHRYLHSLNRRDEEIANNMMRDWKRDRDNGFAETEECQLQIVPEEEIEQGFELDVMTVETEKEKNKVKKKARKKYNRAKHKRKTKRMIKRYYGGER